MRVKDVSALQGEWAVPVMMPSAVMVPLAVMVPAAVMMPSAVMVLRSDDSPAGKWFLEEIALDVPALCESAPTPPLKRNPSPRRIFS